jgi:hypothetical protein
MENEENPKIIIENNSIYNKICDLKAPTQVSAKKYRSATLGQFY